MKKNILLGLTGSIACSKAEQFVQEYKEIYNFKIIATHSSKNYLSDKFLAEYDVISDWDDLNGSPHIDLARFSDSFIIYPATANFIAKINSEKKINIGTIRYLFEEVSTLDLKAFVILSVISIYQSK